MVMQTHFNFAVYLHCLSCYILKLLLVESYLMVIGFRAEVVPLVILEALVTCYLAWQHSVTFSRDMLNLWYDLDSIPFSLFCSVFGRVGLD